MSIQYRIVEKAPLPVKERRARRSRRDFSQIPVGGAAAFPIGDSDPKKLKASIYQSAHAYRKANPDFEFKVVLRENEGEVWVHRIAKEGNGGSPAETVTNGDYRGFAGMTATEMGDNSLAAAE